MNHFQYSGQYMMTVFMDESPVQLFRDVADFLQSDSGDKYHHPFTFYFSNLVIHYSGEENNYIGELILEVVPKENET